MKVLDDLRGADRRPSRAGEFRVLHECVEQAVLAERVGFDRVWSVEHHCLKWYAHLSAPETFLAFVAAKTERIRIGHGVVCLPFRMNHPVKVAERVATLDILSKGRVDFGIGKGGTIQEAGAFQTQMDEIPAQLEESARMIPRMWRERCSSTRAR
jgi:alkanesulfonate monooxygenase SsuD/methylene tetrahydromethanopterin reductase-like flavin-dependent oxidoreductase (luciferase family)